MLRALARINLAATERNAATLRAGLVPGASLCAVVKARASGHGAAEVARAALAGGAASLAVATAYEAAELRAAGVGGEVPILVLGAVSEEELPAALEAGAELVAWDERFVAKLLRARPTRPVRVHVKLDTGMGRLGTRRLGQALAVAQAVRAARSEGLHLHGAMTHFATADGDPEFLAAQLAAFGPFAARMRELGPIVAHAANSAATLRDPASHFDMVRCGIALHGCDPFGIDPARYGLEPVLELSSYVAAVKPVAPGESAGYGRRFVATRQSWLGTVPLGYADAVRRAHSNNGEVLIAGVRHPIVGTISMDNLTVDLGPGPAAPVAVGSAAVLIGEAGGDRITAEDLARRTDTINHEVLCAISERVPRHYHRDGAPVPG